MIHGKQHFLSIEGLQSELPEVTATRYRVPDILKGLPFDERHIEEIPTIAGRKSWTLPVRNGLADYELVVSEDSDFVTFETEVARVRNPTPKLYGVLHEINADTIEGKLVVERSVNVPTTSEYNIECDSIYFTKQIRKQGVPRTTLVEEMVSFDYGVGKVFKEVTSAVAGGEGELLPHDYFSATSGVQPVVQSLSTRKPR